MNKRNILLLLIAVLIIGGLGYYAIGRNAGDSEKVEDKAPKNNESEEKNDEAKNEESTTEELKPLEIGQEAPNFTLENLEGDNVSLEDLRGKTVLINFWATWCPYCVKEMPDMDKLYVENKDDDFVVLAIDVGETREEASKYVEKSGYHFPVLLDTDGRVSMKYFVTGIPTSVMVDKEGKIRAIKLGPMTYPEMKEMLDYARK